MSSRREEKLQKKQREHRMLLDEIEPLRKQRKNLDNRIRRKQKKLHEIGSAIYDLKHEGDTPHVTDHAIVRYLQRVEGVDILELKLKVAKHKQAHREGNVIVTVNELQKKN